MVTWIALALAAAPAELMGSWLSFSRAPAFDRRVTIVEVGTLSSSPKWEYWFRRTVKLGNAKQVWWTDTIRCPATRSALSETVNLTPPQINVPGVKSDDIIIVGDGVAYTFSGPAEYNVSSKISFTSNVGTPLSAWVDESLRKLEPCWAREPPAKVD